MQLDWLSMNFRGVPTFNTLFDAKQREIPNPFFSTIYEYHFNNMLFATVFSNPKSGILACDLVQIKFANRYLYSDQFNLIYTTFLQGSGLVFTSFSRIDLCYDFNTFLFGLNPHTFISNFHSSRYLKDGKSNFCSIGNTDKAIIYDYFRVGSRTSDIQIYLYNKSKELREVKNKPYITELWKKNGLNENKDVWRLEVSIKLNVIKYFDCDTGEKHILNELDIFNSSICRNLYLSLIDKYFSFRYNDQKKRKDRNRKVQLFNLPYTRYLLDLSTIAKDSTRSDRVYLRKCLLIYDIMRSEAKPEAEKFLHTGYDYAARCGLLQYYDHQRQLLTT